MALPELPEGCPYKWAISKDWGRETILVALEDGDPRSATLGGRAVDLHPYDDEEKIVQLVEQAAREVWNELAREIYVRDIVERHWPWPTQN